MKTLLSFWRSLHWVTRADLSACASVAGILLIYSTIESIAEAVCP
jgi:hypothetical protein